MASGVDERCQEDSDTAKSATIAALRPTGWRCTVIPSREIPSIYKPTANPDPTLGRSWIS